MIDYLGAFQVSLLFIVETHTTMEVVVISSNNCTIIMMKVGSPKDITFQ